MVAADSFVLVANPSLGAKSIADLVRIGRGRNLTSSSPGAGSLGHLILERFKPQRRTRPSSTFRRPIPACRTCSAITST